MTGLIDGCEAVTHCCSGSIVDRYENVAVAVSCRTEFVDAVLGEDDRPTVEHPGFAEATDRAISRSTRASRGRPARSACG
jgi:hypothetical protein